MSEPSVRDREIAEEQRHVDLAYDELRRRRLAAAAARAESYAVAAVGNVGALVERDAMVHHAARRLRELDAQHEGLVFGRLDLHGGEVRHVGRIGLLDQSFEPLVVDWRAPAAAAFYQATPAEPGEVRRRRVIRTSGQRVIDVEDDLLTSEAGAADLPVVGEGALMAALAQATGTGMRSIVATIQREQDLAIRAPAGGITTISGGPGTGKTAVATHRAAYLLYSDRRRFEGGGVLIVGPSPVFITYIERVLPSLGESSVTLRDLGAVLDGVQASRVDPPAVAAVKGSATMARFLARAARDVPPGAADRLRVTFAGDVLQLGPEELAAARHVVNRRRRPVNRSQGLAREALVEALWRRRPPEVNWDRQRFADEIVERPAFEAHLADWWPVLTASEVLGWCVDPAAAGRYADGLFTDPEFELLAASWRDHDDPSIADIALLDELRVLLGQPPVRPVPAPDPEEDTMPELTTVADRELAAREAVGRGEDYDGYAHVVVDESQDVSPMQWRMLGRRGRYASWTLVGDPAQSAWEATAEASAARAEALGRRKATHDYRLSTNYRNPQEIFSLAATVLRRLDPDVDLPEAIRVTGVLPEHIATADVAASVRMSAAAMLGDVEGTVGLITPGGWRDDVLGWVGADGRLQVVEALGSKGMEYDGVIVIEPDAIAAATATGVRTLYVALTRATQRLVTVGTTQDWLGNSFR